MRLSPLFSRDESTPRLIGPRSAPASCFNLPAQRRAKSRTAEVQHDQPYAAR